MDHSYAELNATIKQLNTQIEYLSFHPEHACLMKYLKIALAAAIKEEADLP